METLDAVSGSSRVTRDLAIMLSGALLLAGLAGALVFFTLTRRLRTTDCTGGTGAAGNSQGHRRPARDEIDELARAYGLLTTRLQQQYTSLARSDAERRRLIALGLARSAHNPR